MSRRRIRNPILRGFNPDPSICRVGEDYYVAVSTFEWYPGIRIYHSRDLENWRLAARPLNRASMLDMRGTPDSCGIWAPCLSYSDGVFWLCFTDVRRFGGNFKDTHNYLTTCASIGGDWADPLYLNSSGFDPSLFHDEDGRKWYTNMVWDHRPNRTPFHGIVLQEYSVEQHALTGTPQPIFPGTDLGCTEGPHLYKYDGFYYLMIAEGGTGYGHAATMARAQAIEGPYEADPAGPIITTRDDPDWPLQRNGHADLVQSPDGEFYLVHLCGRPLEGTRFCPLGRETAIQRVRKTDDGWFRLADGGHLPEPEIDAPDALHDEAVRTTQYDDFESPELDAVYQWLRTPCPEMFMSLRDRPGFLRLYGMESPGSLYHQALIARRQTDFVFQASTAIDFAPDNFQQLAGIICYYNSSKFHYLYISTDQQIGKHIAIMSCEADRSMALTYPIEEQRVHLPEGGLTWLRASVNDAELRFSWSDDGENWNGIPVVLDQGLLSDEAGMEGAEQFTGAFVGLCCSDLTGARKHADFEFFSYYGRDA